MMHQKYEKCNELFCFTNNKLKSTQTSRSSNGHDSSAFTPPRYPAFAGAIASVLSA